MSIDIAKQVMAFVLRALKTAGDEPMTEDVLKQSIRSAFAHVAFTDGDLNDHIRGCEEQGWIAGTSDALLGKVWALTPKGKIRAQKL